MIFIVAKAIHFFIAALAIVRFDHGSFATQLLLASLLSFLFYLTAIRLPNQTLLFASLTTARRPIDIDTRAHPNPSGIV